MSGSDSTKADKLSIDKRADIFQRLFEHHYKMAMDHHTKAGTTSNILLVVVGAILVLIRIDGNIGCSSVDIVSAVAVIFLGLFGAVWVRKQHERYHYWEFIAREYQNELINIVPGLKDQDAYKNAAVDHVVNEDKFSKYYAEDSHIRDRSLWVFLHIIVMLIGISLLFFSLKECTPCEKNPAGKRSSMKIF